MKRKVLADGNGSNRVMIEGLGEYMPFVDFGLLQSSHDHKARLLDSCEKALEERDQQIEIQNKEIARLRSLVTQARHTLFEKKLITFEEVKSWHETK